ncbi:heterokaryon incompatibility protein-domain-containing protein [Daldinia loculata]|nr:heterokaryon incompatibility protein-domain-containing protein [Daldinia loculata]
MSSSLPSSSLKGSVSTSRFGPRLCGHCNELLSAFELNFDSGQPKSKRSVESEYCYNPYKSARYGCQLCTIFKHRLELYLVPEDECWDKSTLEISLLPPEPESSIEIYLSSTSTSSTKLDGKLAENFAYPGTSCRQRVLDELNSIRAYHDLNYTPPKSTDNQVAWELCDAWIENCINNHSRCNSFHSASWYPTRLLYIGHLPNGYLDDRDLGSFNVQLHLTQDKPPKGGYMTLSHCWGFIAFEMLKLTGETYEYRIKNGFSYIELPKTFQDAIRLSRFLRSDYIWIDSLCIIQGSEDDWIHESKTMMDVYRHSKCNIAATAAQGPTEGCFYPRDPTIVSPLEISLRLGGEKDQPAKKYLFPFNDSWYVNIEHAPLNKRAWVFQERTLAPRQIHCAKDQLSWECNQTTACETFPFIFEPHIEFGRSIPLSQNLASLNLTFSEMRRLRFSEARHDPSLDSFIGYRQEPSDSTYDKIPRFERTLAHLEGATLDERIERLRRDIYLDWNDIASQYSTLELTYKTDRLVAIFGIASQVQEALKDMDIYVAGLWHSQIPWMLFWLASVSDTAPSYDAGPSWSWASVDKGVLFQIVPESHDRVLINVDEAHDGHTAAKQVAISSRRASYLKLRCLIYKIEPDIAANSGKQNTTRFITPTNPRLAFRPKYLRTDYIETDDYWYQAYIIPVVDRRGENRLWGLLVRLCEEEPGCYRRIGMCWIDTEAEPNITEHARGATDEDKVRVTLI